MSSNLPKSAVVVPLYIYPLSAESWAPLYAAYPIQPNPTQQSHSKPTPTNQPIARIETNPSLTFLVIVNPNSGPGAPDAPSPDASYASQLPRLNAYRNVLAIGYIRIDYCAKPLPEALAEISRYASWSEHYDTTGLAVRGIFVDETPNHFSPERQDYLDAVGRFVKACEGILGERFIAHNPGTPPDPRLSTSSDLVFVCEESFSRFRSPEVQDWLAAHPFERGRAGYMLSGVPGAEVAAVVGELRKRAAWIFVTDVEVDFYERFGGAWGGFLAALRD
ncbi:spherulation-specific family 4 protein [Aspergillus mulundensis]|uniref:Spherulation-specific family 4 n=1 Tax=Aspergillus mulundensis TaxID=1810919 RepID=A0A3D8R442_9EURO|nr:hypothetical protein DSM5745_08517 [Aspergillus mulundensis]RDW68757.1 hypothetical protein DSM5745_08517 [Aspergillus mulundensis]